MAKFYEIMLPYGMSQCPQTKLWTVFNRFYCPVGVTWREHGQLRMPRHQFNLKGVTPTKLANLSRDGVGALRTGTNSIVFYSDGMNKIQDVDEYFKRLFILMKIDTDNPVNKGIAGDALRRRLFPYGMMPFSDGSWMFFNRAYKPIGVMPDAWVQYEDPQHRVLMKPISALKLSRLDIDEKLVFEKDDRVWFHRDDSKPEHNAASKKAYFAKLKILMYLDVEAMPYAQNFLEPEPVDYNLLALEAVAEYEREMAAKPA